MKLQKIIFILALTGIILLIFLANFQPIKSGIINSITYSDNKITIELKNQTEKLIIFSEQILNLKIGDEIYFLGKKDRYQNETQIIVDKIIK